MTVALKETDAAGFGLGSADVAEVLSLPSAPQQDHSADDIAAFEKLFRAAKNLGFFHEKAIITGFFEALKRPERRVKVVPRSKKDLRRDGGD